MSASIPIDGRSGVFHPWGVESAAAVLCAVLVAIGSTGWAAVYEDSRFPFSIEVPADWTPKFNRCADRETHASNIVRRVEFLKKYSGAKPIQMLEMTFYGAPGRATRTMPRPGNQNLEGTKAGGIEWVHNKGSDCYAPQVDGLYAQVCLRGVGRASVADLTPADIARLEESHAEAAKAFATFRWRGPAPDAAGLPRLCPGKQVVYQNDIPDDDVAAEADCLLRELARWGKAASLKGDCPTLKGRKVHAALTALGPRAAPVFLRAIRASPFDHVGPVYDIHTAWCPWGTRLAGLVPDLRLLMKDKRAHVRDVGVKTLSCIGPAASSAAADVRRLLEDPDSNVRFSAGRALTSIEPPKNR